MDRTEALVGLGIERFLDGETLFEGELVQRRSTGGGLFPIAPDGDVAEVERVPVEIEHLGIELEDPVTRNTRRRRDERSETIVNLSAFLLGGA